MATDTAAQGLDRADEVAERFTVPVVLAALAAVPAMFLTALEGRPAQAGTAINYVSLAVLTAEAVVLFALASDRRRWLRQHLWLVGVALATIPAVVFAVGPVQVLRLLRFVGALRVLRVRRILRAGRILRTRAGLTGPVSRVVAVAGTVLAAAFVAVVLSDPTSDSRRLLQAALDRSLDRFGALPTVLAGLLVGVSTVVVWRARRDAGQIADAPRTGGPGLFGRGRRRGRLAVEAMRKGETMDTDEPTITSPAFAWGAPIPRKHATDGDNVSPALAFTDVPEGTRSLAVICHDPDAPYLHGFTHWVLYAIPADTTAIPEGGGDEYGQGENDFGKQGYGGPEPPPGHGPHHYYFHVYALDEEIGAAPSLRRRELLDRMEGHVIVQNRFVGTYER